MLNILSLIGERLNRANILWAVGGSVLLSQYGLEDKPHDIDILVDVSGVKKADDILAAIGQRKQGEASELFATKHFSQYIIDGIDVDVMAGLAIRHSAGVYEYIFDRDSVTSIINMDGVGIPFTSLEDWYVIYQLIPGRGERASVIQVYLLTNGLRHPNLLQRALEGNVPKSVKDNIQLMLEGSMQDNLPKDEKVQKFLTDLMMTDEEKFLIVQELRRIVKQSFPDVGERMMYGGIMFTAQKDWGGVFSYENHVSFEFSQGYRMIDPQKCLEGTGKTRRHLKIKHLSNIKEINVAYFVDQAAAFAQNS